MVKTSDKKETKAKTSSKVSDKSKTKAVSKAKSTSKAKSDKKTNNKWGFIAPTRAEAERMEAKYKEHFTPLIDYMKVIFPDDDWEEEPVIEIGDELNNDGIDEYIVPHASSIRGGKIVIIGNKLEIYNNDNGDVGTIPGLEGVSIYDNIYYIDKDTQLTNATVKQIFGVNVEEPLFDENTPTLSKPWADVDLSKNTEANLQGKYIGDEKQYQVNLEAYRATYENIGLSKIIVKKLFDMYDYEIDLNIDKKISILIGPNGCGKTTILKIVRFMLSGEGNIEEILKVPFKSVTCVLASGMKIKLNNSDGKLCAFIDNQKIVVSPFMTTDKEVGTNVAYKNYPILSEKDIKNIAIDKNYPFKMSFKKALQEYKCYFDTEFISAQRLFSKIDDENEEKNSNSVHQYLDNISKIKDEFKRFREETENAYAYYQSDAEHRLFTEYMGKRRSILEDSIFEKEWKEFVKRRNEYAHSQVFSIYFGWYGEMENVISEYKKCSIDKKEFLCLYLEMFKKALTLLEKAQDRILLFQTIINKRLEITKKKLRYSLGEMYLTSGKGRNEKEIPFDVLSSGEKNDFILFFNLIFNCKKSKVFIDEPEISLHIEWQERFIDDLYTICKMNNIQALVATHSPNIINDHTDLIAKWEIKDEL